MVHQENNGRSLNCSMFIGESTRSVLPNYELWETEEIAGKEEYLNTSGFISTL